MRPAPLDHPSNQCCSAGRMLCQTCLVSRYSSRPALAQLAADAGLLVTAPLGLRDVGVVVVDPDRAHPQPAGHSLGLAGVLRPDRARQPVDAVVGDRDRLVLAAEGLDGQHRPERLVLGHRHVAGAPVEHGGQVVEARRRARGPRVRCPPHRSTAPSAMPAATYASTLSRWSALISGPGLGLLVERAAEADRARRARRARRRTSRGSTPRRAVGRRPSTPGRSGGTPR